MKETNEYLESIGSTPLLDGITLFDLLKRPEIEFKHIKKYLDCDFSNDVIEQVVIRIKFERRYRKSYRRICY